MYEYNKKIIQQNIKLLPKNVRIWFVFGSTPLIYNRWCFSLSLILRKFLLLNYYVVFLSQLGFSFIIFRVTAIFLINLQQKNYHISEIFPMCESAQLKKRGKKQ